MNYEGAKTQTGVVMIEFYATWCPHCRNMMPVVDEVRERLNGRVPVYQFDIDKCSDDADAAGVTSVPTFIIYKNGRELWRDKGDTTADALLAAIDRALA